MNEENVDLFYWSGLFGGAGSLGYLSGDAFLAFFLGFFWAVIWSIVFFEANDSIWL